MTSKATTGAVVGTRDVSSLLRAVGRPALDEVAAVDGGVLARQKIGGVWLFAMSKDILASGSEQVRLSATTVCTSWLLAPMPPLVGTITKELARVGIARDAVQAYLRSQLREGTLRALPLLTQDYQPYFAVFRLEDQPEVDRQLEAIHRVVEAKGVARAADLPDPVAPRDYRAWRSTLLHHAEYLGLGRLVDGSLVGWHR